jgi:3,4-dihydroxy 2-butanone 4-phosphate synthase/GTP cyclohydrolase II
MVVVVDDEDRENEGDLIMAADKVRPEDINFMAREARGLICLSLTRARCERLGLKLMVSDNRSPYQTAFTVSIEAAQGVTTGISAFDRAHTIRTAVAPQSSASDLRQPGHIFPLMAEPGGVLVRAGHTEAAADLACLAGSEPAGVLVEIMDEDGRMARRPALEQFAAKHRLRMGSIADLIRYRLQTETSIELMSEEHISTHERLIHYRDRIDGSRHLALVVGTIDTEQVVPVRVQSLRLKRDLLGAGDGLGLQAARAELGAIGNGVLVVLHADRVELDVTAAQASTWRTIGTGAQILRGLGVSRLRALGAVRKFHGLKAFGLELVES